MAFDKDHDGLKRESSSNLQSFGQNGFKLISGGSTVTDDFVAFTALEDTVVTVTIPSGMDADALSSTSIPAGLTVYGKFTSITSSARLIAYKLTEG